VGAASNFVGVPSDCPQRDERLGWMGRCAGVLAGGELQHGPWRHFRGSLAEICAERRQERRITASTRGNRDTECSFAAGWSDAGVIIPWTSWLQTGDTSVIEQNWAAMEEVSRRNCGG